jgi:hypothetical protein
MSGMSAVLAALAAAFRCRERELEPSRRLDSVLPAHCCDVLGEQPVRVQRGQTLQHDELATEKLHARAARQLDQRHRHHLAPGMHCSRRGTGYP